MSLETFRTRVADNVPGRFYVGDLCMDCDMCRELAPANFGRNPDGAYSYVRKQPETPEEEAACRVAVTGCHMETIHDDGDQFDGAAHPAPIPYHLKPEGRRGHAPRSAGH